jgi:hypothetical protein
VNRAARALTGIAERLASAGLMDLALPERALTVAGISRPQDSRWARGRQ